MVEFETNYSLMSFHVGDHQFCVPASEVIEVVYSPRITRIIGTPGFVVGTFLARGVLASAINLGKKFSLTEKISEHTCFIVGRLAKGTTIAIEVDSVDDVFEGNHLQWQLLPSASISTLFDKCATHNNQVLFHTSLDLLFGYEGELRVAEMNYVSKLFQPQQKEKDNISPLETVVYESIEDYVEPLPESQANRELDLNETAELISEENGKTQVLEELSEIEFEENDSNPLFAEQCNEAELDSLATTEPELQLNEAEYCNATQTSIENEFETENNTAFHIEESEQEIISPDDLEFSNHEEQSYEISEFIENKICEDVETSNASTETIEKPESNPPALISFTEFANRAKQKYPQYCPVSFRNSTVAEPGHTPRQETNLLPLKISIVVPINQQQEKWFADVVRLNDVKHSEVFSFVEESLKEIPENKKSDVLLLQNFAEKKLLLPLLDEVKDSDIDQTEVLKPVKAVSYTLNIDGKEFEEIDHVEEYDFPAANDQEQCIDFDETYHPVRKLEQRRTRMIAAGVSASTIAIFASMAVTSFYNQDSVTEPSAVIRENDSQESFVTSENVSENLLRDAQTVTQQPQQIKTQKDLNSFKSAERQSDVEITTFPKVQVSEPEFSVLSTQHDIHHVVKGDTLWFIAKYYLKDPFRYPQIVEHNKIQNPDLIFPKQKIEIIYVDSAQNK